MLIEMNLFVPVLLDAGTGGFWLWQLLGRLHPLLVHFPVGLLCVALLFELVAWNRKSTDLKAGIKALVYIGAGSSVLAALFGYMLAQQEEYGSSTLELHQWSGIATMVFSVITAIAYANQRFSPNLGKSFLTLTVLGVTVAGHYGASLTHGDDYISSVLPFGKEADTRDPAATPTAGEQTNFNLTSLSSSDKPLDPQQIQDLNVQVRTILAHNCYSCHSSTKVKGELRLDSKEFVLKGGEGGPVLVAGQPEKSELIRRIKLPRDHEDAMPTKGKGLTANEIATLEFWIKQGAPWPEGPQKSLYRVAELAPRNPPVPAATKDLTLPVDRFVNAYFQKNKIDWKTTVEDRIYIRRVYLDLTGLIPSPEKIEAFVADTRPDKREVLARELLNRNDDYAQHWLTFWNDALRNDYSGTGYITGGRSDITKWLYTSLKTNKPYNWFVKELISPKPESKGFIRGIEWRGTINSSQRTEMQAAQNVSQVLLGLNLKCASCHDSFISDWKLDDAYAFANVFSDTTLEINRCDKPTGKMAGRRILFKELGEIKADASTEERLRQLADFLTQPKDGRLYRTLVNRVWAQLMGRGIVEPVDMMDNAPWSQDLLDWLAYDFVENGYDIKKLIYTIVTSKTYQLPSVGVKDAGDLVAPNFVFNGMIRRRLTAEQFADAVSSSIGPVYTDSAVVFQLFPEDVKQSIPFARAALVKNDAFLTALGRPNRETVSTSRASQASLLQALELTNGNQFNNAIRRGAKTWKQKYPTTDVLVKQVYRQALGRLPNTQEEAVAKKVLGAAPSEEGIQDFVWSMTLHPEFQLIF
jgi:uncharacterized membrane protein/mono/diheme cytochrome c family protein